MFGGILGEDAVVDGFPSAAAPREPFVHLLAQWAGSEQGDQDREIIEVLRRDLPRELGHAGRGQLEQARGAPAADEFPGGLHPRVAGVGREVLRVDVFAGGVGDEPYRAFHHVQVLDGEHVELEHPEGGDVGAVPLGDPGVFPAVAPVPAQRHQRLQRLGGDDHPAGVHALGADLAVDLPRGVQNLPVVGGFPGSDAERAAVGVVRPQQRIQRRGRGGHPIG